MLKKPISFVTSSKHVFTPWGKALYTTLKGEPVSLAMQEALLTALELTRFEVLNNRNYSKTYSRSLGNGKKQEKKKKNKRLFIEKERKKLELEQKNVILLSRALSLLPIKHKVNTINPLCAYLFTVYDRALSGLVPCTVIYLYLIALSRH